MHRRTFLPFSPLAIGSDEIEEVVAALRSGWITTGPRASALEAAFSERVSAPSSLAVSSGTAAMHTALVGLGIGSGDQVITTPMTFASCVHVIEHVGAIPVLVDIEQDTLNIDPAKVEEALTNQTRAFLPVHYAGHPVALDPLLELAVPRDIPIVEDAAHAFPASYRGRPIGSGDNPVAFSFYATKNITTAEGGMLTGSPDFIERARIVSLHGLSSDARARYEEHGSWYYEVVAAGYKYNLPDVLAALGLAQLTRIDGFQKRRRAIAGAYSEAFAAHDAIQVPIERPEVEHAWHLYVLRLNLETLSIDRNRFIEELKARNIGTSVHFIPIHLHPYFKDRYGWGPEAFPVAFHEYQRIVSLPLAPALTDEDVTDVIEAVIDVVGRFHR